MKRRTFIPAAGAAIFGAGLPYRGTRAQTNRFAPYKGTSLTLSIPPHPHYDAMLRILPRFTEETGIRVEVDRLPFGDMKKRQVEEMGKSAGAYDLICYVVMWKGEYVKKGFLQPLNPFRQNAALADPDFDIRDIVANYLENLGLVGGPKGYLAGPGAVLYGLPYGAETSVLAYRKDVFDELRLTPPANYAEFEALLPVLHDKAGMGALTTRGAAGHQCVHGWLLHLNPLGGRVFGEGWKPEFQNDTGVHALTLLKKIVDTGPPGMTAFGQGEMMNAFLQGDAAMYLDSTVIFGSVRDPAKSKIDGKVGYALHPRGVRQASQTGGLGLAIPKNSPHPEAAWLLMQWLLAKPQDVAVTEAGGSPSRMSTLTSAALLAKFPELAVLRQQLPYANPDWRPIIPVWDEINVKALGVAISGALSGAQTPSQALADVVAPVQQIMKAGGFTA